MLREREQEKPCARTGPEWIFVKLRAGSLDLGKVSSRSAGGREEKRVVRPVYLDAADIAAALAILCRWSGRKMVISRPLRWTISEP